MSKARVRALKFCPILKSECWEDGCALWCKEDVDLSTGNIKLKHYAECAIKRIAMRKNK